MSRTPPAYGSAASKYQLVPALPVTLIVYTCPVSITGGVENEKVFILSKRAAKLLVLVANVVPCEFFNAKVIEVVERAVTLRSMLCTCFVVLAVNVCVFGVPESDVNVEKESWLIATEVEPLLLSLIEKVLPS